MVYEFDGFSWNEDKRRANIAKHGFDFNDAVQALSDSGAFTEASPRGEPRYKTVGIVNGRLAAVIHTPRNGTCRIISMRAARKEERQVYYGDNDI